MSTITNSRVIYNYDPSRQGYDTNLFKTVSGSPTISGGAIRLNAAKIIGYADLYRAKQTMKIKTIKSQYRRDFTAIYECEHCGHLEESSGYDDSYFHINVIPNMTCEKCLKKADASYEPLPTKYPDSQTV